MISRKKKCKESRWVVIVGIYKENCVMMKIGCCTFKPEHCRPKPETDDGDWFCDLYNLKFNSKSIKSEMKKVRAEIKELTTVTLKLKQFKKMLTLEKADPNSKEILEYKKKLAKIKDLGKGLEYLDKAYRYCKRTGK